MMSFYVFLDEWRQMFYPKMWVRYLLWCSLTGLIMTLQVFRYYWMVLKFECHGHKFLGVIIDTKLNHKQHIRSICKKVSKSIGYFMLKSIFSQCILINLYYAYFLYCIMIWVWASASSLDSVRKLQHYLAYTDPLFARLKILKVNDIYEFAIAQYMFHNVGYFVDRRNNPYPTRNANQIAPLLPLWWPQ